MDTLSHSKMLGEEKISKLIFKFSVPCILSLLVSALYNIVDQIFIGNSELSTLGNAATSVVFPVFIISQAFAWWFGDGCAAYLNICLGRNDSKNASRAIGTGISLTLIASLLIIAIIYPLSEPFLMLFGASENSLPYAVEYMHIILLFFPFYMLANMMNSTIRADGSPKYAMMSMVVGAVINVILDPIFIFGFKWGMKGAAIATVTGQFVSFLIGVVYYFHTKTFKVTPRDLIPNLKVFREPFILGISTFFTQISILIVTTVTNFCLAKFGAESHYGVDIPVAIVGNQTKVYAVINSIVVGTVLGCQPIVSYNIGAKKYDRVKKIYTSIFSFAAIVGILATLLFQLAPEFVVGLFGEPTNIPNPEDYWDFGVKTFRIYLMFIMFNNLVKINSIFFQAVGKPLQAVITSLVRDMFCFVPLALILPRFWGVEGILYAAPCADLLAIITAMSFMVPFLMKLNNNNEKLKLEDKMKDE